MDRGLKKTQNVFIQLRRVRSSSQRPSTRRRVKACSSVYLAIWIKPRYSFYDQVRFLWCGVGGEGISANEQALLMVTIFANIYFYVDGRRVLFWTHKFA
jgi:hypothetical protein